MRIRRIGFNHNEAKRRREEKEGKKRKQSNRQEERSRFCISFEYLCSVIVNGESRWSWWTDKANEMRFASVQKQVMCVCLCVCLCEEERERTRENDSSNITRRKWMEPKAERKRSSNWLKCERSPQQHQPPHSDLILFISRLPLQKRDGSGSGGGCRWETVLYSISFREVMEQEKEGNRPLAYIMARVCVCVCVCTSPRSFIRWRRRQQQQQ